MDINLVINVFVIDIQYNLSRFHENYDRIVKISCDLEASIVHFFEHCLCLRESGVNVKVYSRRAFFGAGDGRSKRIMPVRIATAGAAATG